MLFRLHAFDQDLVAAIADETDHVLQHRPAAGCLAVMQEGAVNLYGIKIRHPQPGKARKSGSEIIQPYIDAERLQIVQTA